MNVKSMDRIREKWVRSTQANQAEYRAGVESPKKDWAAATAAAEDNYKAGVQAAISAGRFGKGVRKAGTAKWQEKTLAKGPDRWAQGVSLGAPDFEAGYAPYRTVLETLTLPPRGPKGDPRNILRVAKVAEALHAKKLSGGA
jgi:hypothetical protein